MNKIALIVDDDRTERRLISHTLQKTIDLSFAEAENGKEALRILAKDDNNIALIVLDMDMPVMGGMETLGKIKQSHPHIPVIILTGNKEPDIALKAMKMGAADFLSKPVENARLDVSTRNALKMSLMTQEISRLKRRAEDELIFSDLIGHNAGLANSVKIGQKAAACDLPVLITGETGTGKEIFSRAIHGESQRVGNPFIAINCGAIPEKLVESILFGHEKGAFTGATNKALGKFQEASGGTIFLDEIGELPLDTQVKLLRVLQESEVEPVGAGKSIAVDVRIVSATNRDLIQEVKEGRFREDLYFRLNVLHIDLPPLRTRKSDIPLIAQHFIDHFCASHQTLPKEISKDAMTHLQNYDWPGNVRELENTINRAMALSDEDQIGCENLSFMRQTQSEHSNVQEGIITPTRADGSFKSYKELEHEIVELALKHHGGNMSQTARVLGIAKSTLYTKLESLSDQRSA